MTESKKEYNEDTVKEEELVEIPRFKPWRLYKCSKSEKIRMILLFIFTLGWVRIILQIIWHFILAETLRLFVLGADHQKPYSKTRRRIIVFWSRLWSRIMMFTLGFWWIKEKGKENLKKFQKQTKKRIIVSNHQTLIDIPLLHSLIGCSFLSKGSVKKAPFIGITNTITQGMYMYRNVKNSLLIDQLKKRYENDDYVPLCIFAEGTTTNGEGVITFRKGAFETGYTIHPVRVEYKGGFPFKFTQTCFTHQSLLFLILSIFANPINYVEVTYLEPYEPSEEEKKDAILFATNMRKVKNEI
ncbi:lysophosphatidylcholine acyltransferase 1 [Anaeramoeba flamelloides]|uniref:Lysophosphatidylcholine acyltransferase 1 n=1 Tax=Anaeramoeba flamelloides TaxID=1746091 RepID=A0ABQ8XX24_9EUKA|nr:lysophosphatidylcholine acyltransferase 1 [Anaeramoeba flamelloides]